MTDANERNWLFFEPVSQRSQRVNSKLQGRRLADALQMPSDAFRSGHSIAVIGDGAITGGMAWEAMNHARDPARPSSTQLHGPHAPRVTWCHTVSHHVAMAAMA